MSRSLFQMVAVIMLLVVGVTVEEIEIYMRKGR
jgi:hypothetical protein